MPDQERACPVCREWDLRTFLEADGVPLCCNAPLPTEAEARAVPRGDIRLGFCPGCGTIFNAAVDPTFAASPHGGASDLQHSPRFREYARDLARRLQARHRPREVVEVGGDDGWFSRLLCGDEHAGDRRKYGRGRAATGLAPEQRTTLAAADLVCCRHLLERVGDPRAFLELIRGALRPGTPVYFEVPDARWTLRHGGGWDVLYERCAYFSPASARRLFAEADFHVLGTSSAFAGQFLQIEAVAGGGRRRPARGIEELARLAERFTARHARKLERWRARVGTLGKVALWGAGRKGTMFLNAVGGAVGRVVDVDPRKQGRHVPGTGHPIAAPETLRAWEPDTVVVVNPVYLDEIVATVRGLGLRAGVEVA